MKIISRTNILTLAFANAVIFAVAYFWVFHGIIWTDEGWYYGGAVLFSKGYLPYVDFLYHRLPLHVEVYGSLFKIFGSSFVTGRMISLCLFMVMINICAWSVNRITKSRYATLLTYLAFINIPAFLGYLTVSTYSLSALLFALILVVILSERLVLEAKLFIFVVLNFLICANRYLVDYHAIFLLLALPVLLIYYRKSLTAIASILSASALGGLYLFKYTVFLGDRNIFYDTIAFNFIHSLNFSKANPLTQYGLFPENSQGILYKLNLFAHLRWLEIQSYFAIWIVCFAAISVLAWMAYKKNPFLAEGPRRSAGLLFCVIIIVFNFGFYYISVGDWPVDKLYVFPYMIVVAVWLITFICQNITDRISLNITRGIFAVLFLGTGFLRSDLNFTASYNNSDVFALRKVSASIKKHTPKAGGRMLTFTPVLANSGMLHESGLNMELYAFSPFLDNSDVMKRKMMDAVLLKDNILNQRYDLIALSGERFFQSVEHGMVRLIMPFREEILKDIYIHYVEVETVQTPHFRRYFKIFIPRKLTK